MPAIVSTLGMWAIRIIAAIFAWVLIEWLVPLFFDYVHFPVPDLLVKLLALLVALCILFSGWWWPRFSKTTA